VKKRSQRRTGQLIARLLQERNRDLIFVGYSYGGLVVKQIREMARSRSGLIITYLSDIVCGELFN
jgi:hypothetical protein